MANPQIEIVLEISSGKLMKFRADVPSPISMEELADMAMVIHAGSKVREVRVLRNCMTVVEAWQGCAPLP